MPRKGRLPASRAKNFIYKDREPIISDPDLYVRRQIPSGPDGQTSTALVYKHSTAKELAAIGLTPEDMLEPRLRSPSTSTSSSSASASSSSDAATDALTARAAQSLYKTGASATTEDQSAFTSICVNYELGHQESVEEHLRDYIASHPNLAQSEAELRPQVEAGVVALKFFRAKYGPEKYNEFVDIMEGFQTRRLDHDGVKQELLAKFGYDTELFQCVNLFLPPAKKFELPPTTGNNFCSSNKQTQTTSSSQTVAEGAGEVGEGCSSEGASGKPMTMRAKLTIPMDSTVPISGTIPVPMLPVNHEEIKPVYNPEKVSNILLFLAEVKRYSEELFIATMEIFHKNQNSEVRSKPFLYLRVYEQLMTLYADHPELKQSYRHFFGPVNVINGNDGAISIQLPVNHQHGKLSLRGSPGSICCKCASPWEGPSQDHTSVHMTSCVANGMSLVCFLLLTFFYLQ